MPDTLLIDKDFFHSLIDKFDKNKTFFLIDDYFPTVKNINVYYLKADENHKTLQVAEKILAKMQQLKIKNDFDFVAIGGGVTTDLGGFTANVYQRGISLTLIPTTLLCMVDASIGGKNGVNFNNIKNSIGTVYMPERIVIDIKFLESLPHKQIVSGFIEMAKIFLLCDENAFDDCCSFPILTDYNKLSSLHKDLFLKLINKAKSYKEEIVQKDLHSKNIRHLLNLGHTLGHGIELQFNVPHGTAVGLGLLFTAYLSKKIYGFTEYSKIAKFILKLYDYETLIKRMNVIEIMSKLTHDKKNSDNESINFILLKKTGQYPKEIKIPVDVKFLKETLNEFQLNYNKI